MSPIHIGAGLVIGGLVIASVVALELYTPPDAQRLLVKNDYADAKCEMQFANGFSDAFSVRKGAEHRKTYKNRAPGFIIARCRTADRTIELPGSFHLMSHSLAQIVLKEDGTAEFTFQNEEQR